MADGKPVQQRRLEVGERQQLALLADAVDQIGVLVVEHICRPVRRNQHIGELLEDVPHLIAVLVPRHLLQAKAILWHCSNVAVISQAGSFGVNGEAVGDQRWVSATLNSAHQSACGISSMITCHSCRRWKYGSSIRAEWVMNRISPSSVVCFSMLDDVGDHPIAGLAVDRPEPDSGRQTGEVGQGLVDQENARLDEQTFLPSRAKRWAYRTAAYVFALPHGPSTKYKIKCVTPVQKKSPHGLADTVRASPLECLLSRAWA